MFLFCVHVIGINACAKQPLKWHLVLVLADSRQGPGLGHHTDEECAYGPRCLPSWLLKDAAESADATVSGMEFHSLTVRVEKEYLYSSVFDLNVSSFFLFIFLSRDGLTDNVKFNSAIGTATWPLRILYIKASLWMRHLVCRGSNFNCSSSDVTLVSREYDDRIHLAADRWIFSNLFEFLVVCGSQIIDAYSMPDLTSAM